MWKHRGLPVAVAAVLAAGTVFGQWAAGSSPVIGRGESVTVSSAQPNIVRFIDNGTLTFAAGGSVTVTGTVVTAVGSGVGESGVLNLSGGNVTKTGSGYLVIGYLGGTGSLTVASGSTLTVTGGSRIRLAGNEDGQRELLSRGTAEIAGTLNTDVLEFTGFFPTNLTPPYAEHARLTLQAGGVVETGQFQKNDCAVSVFLFNGGTLRAKSTTTDFMVGRGVLDLVIADGANAVFDTNGKNVTINPQGAPYETVLTLRGETGEGALGNGGFVKTGAGTLALRLPEACNTFTGAVAVLQGTLDLGRPLAAGQTVTVSAGAHFVVRSPSDIAKITYLGSGADRMLYTVAVDTGELDLTALNAMYYDDRLGGPLAGSALLSNTLTHAAGTVGNPFRLVGQGGTLNLTNTTLENKAVQVEGAGTFNFLGSRTFTAADAGKLAITDGGYRQELNFSLADADAGTPAALSLATGRFLAGSLLDVGVGGFGVFGADGAAVTVGKIQVGGGAGFAGAFNQSTGVVTVSNESLVGLDGGTGTLTVAGGQFIVNSNLRVASNPSVVRSLRPQGTVTVSNALLRCTSFYLTSWWPTDGTAKTVEAGLLRLLPGGTAEVNEIYKNDDPVSTVQFSGGVLRARTTSASFLNAAQTYGTLRVVADAGQYATLDTQGYEVTVTKPVGTLAFSGAGGLKKRGSGRLTFSANQVAYAGDTVVEAGVLRLGDHNQIPHGPATGHVQLASGTVLDLNGKSDTVNRLIGLGLVVNTNAPAMLGVLADGSDSLWDRTWLSGPIALDKQGAGTLTLAAAQAAPTNLTVSAGAVRITSAEGFPFYRFKIEGVKNPATANAMQFSEIALYNDGVNVTPNRVGIAYDSTGGIGTSPESSAFPAGEMPEKAVDGIVNVGTTTGNKWLDFRLKASRSAADKERVWLRIDFANAQKITHYNWATGNDAVERDPAAWRLQGSYDGVTWVDLDVQTGYSATATRNAWVTTGGFPVSSVNTADVVNDNALVNVAQGASLTLDDGVSETFAGLTGAGAVTVAGGTLTIRPPAGAGSSFYGNLAGSGEVIKTGAGEWGLGGSNSFSGTLSVRQGTLAVLGGAPDRWFRYTIRENKGATNVTQLCEFALYSGDGVRRNLGLTQGSGVETLLPGQCASLAAYALGNPATETVDKLFDNNTGTKWCLINNFMSLGNPATHRTVVMRLAADTPEITGYNLCTANDVPERDPVNWTLESSPDGVTWRTVDTRAAVDAPVARYTWYNSGTAFTLAARAVTAGGSGVLGAGVAVEIRAGATLDCRDGADAMSALHVDMLDAGAMTVFKAAPGGTLSVVNVSGSPVRLVLPLVIGVIEGRDKLGSWAVYVNGVRNESVRLSVTADGYLTLSPKGTLVRIQ